MDCNKTINSRFTVPASNAPILNNLNLQNKLRIFFSGKQAAEAESISQNQYSSNIDIMRAVAVFGVVAHHIGAFTGFHIYFFSGIGALFGVQLFLSLADI